jgi:hypothetical protein
MKDKSMMFPNIVGKIGMDFGENILPASEGWCWRGAALQQLQLIGRG